MNWELCKKKHLFLNYQVGPSSRYRGKLSLVSKPKKRKLYVGDLSSDDFSSPKKAKRHFRFLKTTIFNQRKKIKVLQQNVRRLRGKINSMESLVRLLKQKSLISESSETAIEASVWKVFSRGCLKDLLLKSTIQCYELLH